MHLLVPAHAFALHLKYFAISFPTRPWPVQIVLFVFIFVCDVERVYRVKAVAASCCRTF
jgi:hypothetical protein